MRVLVADDHSLFRDGIISLLEAAGFEVVGQVGNGQAALEAALRLQPDLVLLDISMPVVNGLEALRQIRASLPDTQVVMLTVSDDDQNIFEAIQSGAQGYLLKSQNAEGFLASLRGLERGEMAMTRQTSARLIGNMIQQTRDEEKLPAALSVRELELLYLLADGMSNKAIAQKLSISENTAKYHLRNILQKLNAQNRTEAVAYAARTGLLKTPRS